MNRFEIQSEILFVKKNGIYHWCWSRSAKMKEIEIETEIEFVSESEIESEIQFENESVFENVRWNQSLKEIVCLFGV